MNAGDVVQVSAGAADIGILLVANPSDSIGGMGGEE